MNKYNYNPLPEYLTIKKSKLHGKGLFIKKNYSAALLDEIGITHYLVNGKVVRSPLGGFINDGGENANCTLMPTNDEGKRVKYGEQTTYTLLISKAFVSNEELLIDYSKWMWILDGSLYPPDYEPYLNHATDLGRKPPLPSEQIGFYSPYNLGAGIPIPDVKSVNVLQDATFSFNYDDYIGAPGGEEVQTASYTLEATLSGDVRLKINNASFTLEELCENMRDNYFYNWPPIRSCNVIIEDKKSMSILSDKINTKLAFALKDFPQYVNQYEIKFFHNLRSYTFRLRSVATAVELAKEHVDSLMEDLAQGEEKGYWAEKLKNQNNT